MVMQPHYSNDQYEEDEELFDKFEYIKAYVNPKMAVLKQFELGKV